jgi:transposase-like protein
MSQRPLSSLRAALATHEPARGKRYSPELKVRIIEVARGLRADGASWQRIAEDIGIAFETIRRWCIAAEGQGARSMVPVRVVADRAERTVSVASPAGHRIEGLTLAEAVAVLRALG